MSEEILLSAIGYLDEDIVGEYVEKKLKLQESETRKKSTLLTKISLVAAALVLVFSAFIIWQSSLFESAEAVAPDMSKVVWDTSEYFSGGPITTDIPMINGVKVSHELKNAFESNNDKETVFALYMHLSNDADIEKAIRYFEKRGIYCEVKNERVFIFVTEEQFRSMRLSSVQKKNYSFGLSRKALYE